MTILLRALLVLVAATLAIVGGYNNGLFWWLVMAPVSLQAQVGFLTLSIACGAIKILVPAYLAATRVTWFAAPKAALAAFAVAILFDVASGLGYAGMTRAAATAEQRDANVKHAAAVKARDDASAALARLPQPTRSIERITSDMASEDARAGGCGDRRAGRDACAKVHQLRGESSDAHAWTAARDDLQRAERHLSALPAPRDPDPQLAAFEKALAMFGAQVPRERLEAAWGLLMLLLLEFGAFPLIAFALAPVDRAAEPRQNSPGKPVPLPPPPALTADQLAVLAILRGLPADADGWAVMSLAGVAKATGRSSSTVSRDIERLVAAGRIAKETRGGRGFRVRAV